MSYIPQLYPRKDHLGNVQQVEVVFDKGSKTYVGYIRGGAYVSNRQPVVACGECVSPHGAADQAIFNYVARKEEKNG